ncbi:MAG TPA: translation initiation factor IF-2, partial [Bacteroidia bacterium]|nr:translation initiation factor IF-2 [Bacteroidia bacterium]
MSETKSYRLIKVAVEFNISKDTLAEFLSSKGYKVDAKNPNAKIGEAEYGILMKEFQGEKIAKQEAKHVAQITKEKKETIVLDESKKGAKKKEDADDEIVIKDLTQSATSKALEQLREESKQRIADDAPKKKTADKETPFKEEVIKAKTDVKIDQPKVLSTIDLASLNTKTKPDKKNKKEEEEEKPKKGKKKETEPVNEVKEVVEAEVKPESTEPKEDFLETKFTKLDGPKILGKVELPVEKKPSSDDFGYEKKKRKRIKKTGSLSQEEIKKVGTEQAQIARQKFKDRGTTHTQKRESKPALTDEEIQAQIKETLARLSQQGQKSKTAKYRREKRSEIRERMAEEQEQIQADKSTLKVTEFVSANELAQMMSINVTQVIATCMQLGLFVSINQRLDAETIAIVAEEFGYKIEFVSAEEQEVSEEQQDKPEDLLPRPPVVTVMGHVDHGKTSLLDYIRKANVLAGEAGGITQHIGAYKVKLHDDKRITFLDTPGHEAFTAMRARGSKLADVAIIVIAADDSVMPQTKEAINHAQAANVPMVFAINKIDKPGAAPDKIREALAQMNILVEEWGGKFQCQEISAKQGKNVDTLLEKVLLEADMLQLAANPDRLASGAVIEATMEEGRGYVANILVQSGTLHVGDVVLAGCHSGRVRAMFNERGQKVTEAGPSTPVKLLGLSGAPQAGDKFTVMEDERESREIANKRLQLQREQGMRTKKHITLDEIGRRLAIGDFKELNIIVKGDVDGSIEALSDSLLKLSTQKVQVNIIHKSVGAISESDVMLASASNAIIVGFQVRPTGSARKLAEEEQIDVRLYSIIYDAIN